MIEARENIEMIFITLGSQKFQFNRLLEAVDRLVETGEIEESIFAQTGYSDYRPLRYQFVPFLNHDEFEKYMESADIVITHGGTGAIIGAVKKGKKVIAVPRLEKYGEHVDDHQTQLIDEFTRLNLVCGVRKCDDLGKALKAVREMEFSTYESNSGRFIEDLGGYIEKCRGEKA